MAYGDYRHCDKCDAKAFYDANLNYDYDDEENTPFRVCGKEQEGRPYSLSSLGDWAVLCQSCAKTHRTMIVLIEQEKSGQESSELQKYWVGWYEYQEDFKPLICPANKHILGWWATETESGYCKVCALIVGYDQSHVREAIMAERVTSIDKRPIGQPDFFRFFELVDVPWRKFETQSGLELSDWMQERFDEFENWEAI